PATGIAWFKALTGKRVQRRSALMIHIPFYAEHYTATMGGSVLKVVPCENCSTEYVYVIERQATGAGTSWYMLNNEGAASQATSAAEDTLKSVLKNDFDPVPCPVCGHYQRYMFPKLLKTTWVQPVMVAVLLIGSLVAAGALYWSAAYLLRPSDEGIGNMVAAW